MNYKSVSVLALIPIGCLSVFWASSHLFAEADEKKTPPPKKTIEVSNNQLTLNGSAIRTVFGFEIYHVGLYLTNPNQSADAIFRDRDRKRVEIKMLRDVSGKKFESTVRKNIKTNFSTKERENYAAELERFLDCFVSRELSEGCVVKIDYVPSKGTQVFISDKQIDLIPGDDFHHALLRLWIGKPPQKSVKEGLLGLASK